MKKYRIEKYEVWNEGQMAGFPWKALSDDPGTYSAPAGGFRSRYWFRTLKDARAFCTGEKTFGELRDEDKVRGEWQ